MLNHKGTVVLETERLILRRFQLSDAKAIFNNWAKDVEVTEFMTWQAHENVEITQKIVKEWIKKYKKDDYYHWIIIAKDNNEPIGSFEAAKISEGNCSCEIGYCLSKKNWGKGYMVEVTKRINEFLFNEVGFNRIVAHHFILNPKSGRVMEKAGMKFEGIMREAVFNNEGVPQDVKQYAILKKDIR